MRTTISIDDDILRIARFMARDTHESLGHIISRLVRKGLEAEAYSIEDSGLPLFEVSENTPLFGPEDVARSEDDL